MAHTIATEGIKKGVSTYLMYGVPPGIRTMVDEERQWTEHLRERRSRITEGEMGGVFSEE